MYNTFQRMMAWILLGSHILITVGCNGNLYAGDRDEIEPIPIKKVEQQKKTDISSPNHELFTTLVPSDVVKEPGVVLLQQADRQATIPLLKAGKETLSQVVPKIQGKQNLPSLKQQRLVSTKQPVYPTKPEVLTQTPQKLHVLQDSKKSDIAPIANMPTLVPSNTMIIKTPSRNRIEQEPHPSIALLFQQEMEAHLLRMKQYTQTRQGQYQLARIHQQVMKNFAESHRPMTTSYITTRGGHQVNFLQHDNHWLAKVHQNCAPGFERTLNLPVLYPTQSQRTPFLDPQRILHTVESLLTLNPELQRQLIHIVFPERGPNKQGFVYTGAIMGLNGGGFWSFIGKCLVTIVVSAAVGAAIGCGVGLALGIAGGAMTGLIGGLVGGLGQCIKYYLDRGKTTKELKTRVEAANNACDHLRVASDKYMEVFDKQINHDNDAYTNMASTVQSFRTYQEKITHEINKLKRWREHVVEEDIIWDDDLKQLDQQISSLQSYLNKIDKQMKVVRDKCRERAVLALASEKKHGNQEARGYYEVIHEAVAGVTTPDGLDKFTNNVKALRTQINSHISRYESWSNEPALFQREDKRNIEAYLHEEQARLTDVEQLEALVKFIKQDNVGKMVEHCDLLQSLAQADSPEKLWESCSDAIKKGCLPLIYYAIRFKQSLDCIKKSTENTLLHQAVLEKKPQIVKLLLQYGADKAALNKRKKTPIDLAEDKPEIKELFQSNIIPISLP